MRGAVLASLVAAGVALTSASLAGSDPMPPRSVHGATTGNASELRETIPISPTPGGEKRAVMSLGPKSLPALVKGRRLRVSAEVQLSMTCVTPGPHCIGRPYGFSPRITGWVVLADRRRRASGPHTMRVSGQDSMQCGQRRPNRNHHCVLVIHSAGRTIRNARKLPCRPKRCFINMVVSANHPSARPGNVRTVGPDLPGTVLQDKGRLNALVASGRLDRASVRTDALVSRRIPIAPEGIKGRRAVYSVKLPPLRAGSVVTASARQRSSIAGLPYNVFIGSRLILATDPDARTSRGVARRLPAPGEHNGFNCTHGPSAYRNPCLTRKVGLFEVRRAPVNGAGEPVDLYLTLVLGALAKLHPSAPGDRARALPSGELKARVYSATR
jgi:hypothetical protein